MMNKLSKTVVAGPDFSSEKRTIMFDGWVKFFVIREPENTSGSKL